MIGHNSNPALVAAASEINTEHKGMLAAIEDSETRASRIGQVLIDLKPVLKEASVNLTDFCKEHLPFGKSAAYEFINIAKGTITLQELNARKYSAPAEKPAAHNNSQYRGPSEEMAQAIRDLAGCGDDDDVWENPLGPDVGEGFDLAKLLKKVSKLVTAIEHQSTDPIRKEQLQHQLDKMNARYGSYLVGKCVKMAKENLNYEDAERNSFNVDREYISEKLAEFALDETYDLAWRKAQIADWIEKDLSSDEALMTEFNWIMENKHEYETQPT